MHTDEIQLGTREHFPPAASSLATLRHVYVMLSMTIHLITRRRILTSTPIHICSTIPGSACNHGTAICLEILRLYVAENPEALTDAQVGSLVGAAIARPSKQGSLCSVHKTARIITQCPFCTGPRSSRWYCRARTQQPLLQLHPSSYPSDLASPPEPSLKPQWRPRSSVLLAHLKSARVLKSRSVLENKDECIPRPR